MVPPEQKKATIPNTPEDLSRFTLPSSPLGEEKKVVFTPFETSDEGNKPFVKYFTSNPLWIGVYIILFFVALVSGAYLFRVNTSSEDTVNPVIPTITAVPDNIPTPTSAEEPVDMSSFSVIVLNGSGIRDEAGRAKALLEENGFTVSSTGNTKRHDSTTRIQVKQAVPDAFVNKLTSVLGIVYELGDIETLSDSEKDSVVVIVGTTKK